MGETFHFQDLGPGTQTWLLIGLIIFKSHHTQSRQSDLLQVNFKMLLGSKITPTRAFCSCEDIILFHFSPSSTEQVDLQHRCL